MAESLHSYKVLNAELMEEVQMLRMLIGEYKEEVVHLVRENMGLREEQIRQNGGKQQSKRSGIRKMMRRCNFGSFCLGSSSSSSTLTTNTSASRRRYNDIDIVMEVSEEAPEIGQPTPNSPTIEEDITIDEDPNQKQADKDTFFRKIGAFCSRKTKSD